jgi:hypothetical protein
LEIDLVLERAGQPTYLIEIKSTTYVNDNHTGVLERYSKDIPNSIPMLLSQDSISKKVGAVNCLHWLEGIREMEIDPR